MVRGQLRVNDVTDTDTQGNLESSRRRYGAALVALVLTGLAYWHAFTLSWLCDDAFASFRYAQNWARGIGLVFNAHERVEGITNPLWTIALGVVSRWGFNIERAALQFGIWAFVLCVLGLYFLHARQRAKISLWSLPIGALLAVADRDWATFATGGLETSAFSLSVLVSYILAWTLSPVMAGMGAGLGIAVCGMLRPDGAIFVVPLALAFVGKRRAGLLPYLAGSLVPLAAFHVWRHGYYGSWLPNTYYAKSAFLSWWSQGFVYLGYFALRHAAVIAVALAASAYLIVQSFLDRVKQGNRASERPITAEAGLHGLVVAWAMILAYTLSVVRVGGDFMYARMLVPALPLLYAVLDLTLVRVFAHKRMRALVLGLWLLLATWAWPCPVDTNIVAHSGVVDERAYYQLGFAEAAEKSARLLRECTQGYPTRVAIYGGELRLAYRARFPYVIEAHAGLMDPVIAHRPIVSRQRVGHEKSADAAYLVLTKKAHFATSPLYGILSDPSGFIPEVHANLCGVDVRLLHWDRSFIEYVRSRGAQVPEFTSWLDELLARLDSVSDTTARVQYEAAEHFYFAHNLDPVRKQMFLNRLARSRPAFP